MLFGVPALLCIFLARNSLAAPYLETEDDPKINYRLDGSVIPSNYKISLTPYILQSEVPVKKERFTFDGKTEITLKATTAQVKEIVLHAKALTFTAKPKLRKVEGNIDIEIKEQIPDEKTDKLTLILKDALELNKDYILSFEYVGILGNDMKGFYKSFYKGKDGKEVWLASTQFQTHHARRAFPCFDEPKYKATFDIVINRHNTLTAVSNTILKNTKAVDNDRLIDTFETTPPMSTYIVAFIVSDFRHRVDNGNTNFSVLARPDAFDQTSYSFEIGKSLLAKFDNYFELPYQNLGNKKMDLAAIPDFSAGAMENWGLLTFRERVLLYDSSTSTVNYQQSIAATVAHEQAHMWFGDYVTCDWWSYAWLNEGFARYFQYFILHEVNSGWDLDKQFPVDQIQSVFNIDSRQGVHPLSDPSAETPADLAKMFDTVTYNKGAAVIRMINHLLGDNSFKSALHSYLKNNALQTSVPKKLFDEFKSKWTDTNIDIVQILEDFTEQVGYPLVTVKVNKDGKNMDVTQQRFLLQSSDGSDASLLYTIPFTYTTNEKLDFTNTKPSNFLKKTKDATTIPIEGKADFVIANIKQTGYYRVNYDESTWHKIHKFLDSDSFERIDENNRAQIVDDLFNLGQAKVLKYDLVLNILEYLKREQNYIPWTAALKGFSNIEVRLGTEHRDTFGKHILRITKKVYEKLGFDEKSDEKRLDTYNRAKILDWVCRYGNKDCIAKSQDFFKQLVQKSTQVPINIRQPVYCTAIREGTAKDFEYLWQKYLKENVATEEVLILNALGCSKSKETVELYLRLVLTHEVRLQDKSAALTAAYSQNVENIQVVFDYVIKNYKDFASSLGSLSDVATLLSNIASRFTNTKQQEELKKFYEEKKIEFGDSAKTLEKALKTVEQNLKWSSELLQQFVDILKAKNSSSTLKSFNVFIGIMLAAIAMSWFR